MLLVMSLLVVIGADPSCVTSGRLAACGYACATTGGQAACARTPLGRCITTNGNVFCGDPSWAALRAGVSEPVECVTTNGTGACGYHCLSANGQVACASTPWGRCVTTNGRVFCGDPAPGALLAGFREPVECVTANGTGACGYHCATAGGEASCAATPLGRCVTAAGRVFCGDPSWAALEAGVTEPVACVTANGVGACGYQCLTANGRAACASAPWGRCVATSGDVFCSREW